jgi:hypothetical protein
METLLLDLQLFGIIIVNTITFDVFLRKNISGKIIQ